MAIYLIGGTSGATADVDSASKALKTILYAADGNPLVVDSDDRLLVSPRPPAIGTLGGYRLDAETGAIAATLAANSPLFSFRWGDATRLAIIEHISVSVAVSAAITTAVAMSLEAIIARGFTASDSAGTQIVFTNNSGKSNADKTSMGGTLVTDVRIAATGTLTAGTRTLDNNGFGGVNFGTGTAVGTTPLAKVDLYRASAPDGYPIILAQNEGFIIRNPDAGPATGTFKIMVSIGWTEVLASSYNL